MFGAKNVGDTDNLLVSAGINGTRCGRCGGITVSGGSEGNPACAIQSATTSATVKAGTSATINLLLTGINGFSGPVTLSCTGLPIGDTCTFNPAAVTSSGA